MIDWDDLRYFLATVRAGTYSAAAAELGVNRTTVARRVANLERRIGHPLLEPATAGLAPSPTGRELLKTAQVIEKQVDEAGDRLARGGELAAGPLRVAAPVGLGPEFMAEIIAFARAWPQIDLELVTDPDPAYRVSQRQAEVGLVVSNHPPEHLLGPLVAELTRALYAAPVYLAEIPADMPLRHHRWVAWGRDMAQSLVATWMKANLPDDIAIGARVNSWTAMKEAVAGGVGVGYLWRFLAETDPRVVAIRSPQVGLSMGVWLLTHEDVPANRRVELFLETFPALLAERIRRTTPEAAVRFD